MKKPTWLQSATFVIQELAKCCRISFHISRRWTISWWTANRARGICLSRLKGKQLNSLNFTISKVSALFQSSPWRTPNELSGIYMMESLSRLVADPLPGAVITTSRNSLTLLKKMTRCPRSYIYRSCSQDKFQSINAPTRTTYPGSDRLQ